MEQILHFCRSSDGTRIAYATYNDLPNTPLVVVNPWFHPEESWRLADLHGWYVTMAGKWRLVGFDRRGIGSSQRDVTDVSIAAQVSDLAAVVDHLGLDKFHLAGFIDGAPVAAAFAAEHPSRIDRLAFTGLCGRGADAWDPGVAETLLRTIASSWPMARLALSEMVWGGLPAQLRRSRSRALAKAMSPEVAMKYVELWTGYDVRELLPRIQAPTLVMQYPAGSGALASSREAASLIPNAQYVTVAWGPPNDVLEHSTPALVNFLSQAGPSPPEIPGGTATVLFADIASSTAMTEQLGDDAFRAAANRVEAAARSAIKECGGVSIEGKLLGDGVLAVFPSARPAIEAALALAGITEGAPPLQLHLGIHAGDVIREGGTIYGGTVNIAARISDQAVAGEVLVSRTVRDLARTSSFVDFEDRGEVTLKGIAEPQQLFAVRRRVNA